MNKVGAIPRKQGKSDCENSSNNMSSEHVWFMAQILENWVQVFFFFRRRTGVRGAKEEEAGREGGRGRTLRGVPSTATLQDCRFAFLITSQQLLIPAAAA